MVCLNIFFSRNYDWTHCLNHQTNFYLGNCGSYQGSIRAPEKKLKFCIQLTTANGLRHASGPVHTIPVPLHICLVLQFNLFGHPVSVLGPCLPHRYLSPTPTHGWFGSQDEENWTRVRALSAKTQMSNRSPDPRVSVHIAENLYFQGMLECGPLCYDSFKVTIPSNEI